jgi:HD-like signal output (HDOD) protein/CheY-like chemotaxis protein
MTNRRILFVDDEPMVLQSLGTLLWKERSKWDMVFANNGNDALAELDRATFDLIICDMTMPGMDGFQLLTEVSSRFPTVVRVALSAESTRLSALKTIPIVHQYLSKPLSGVALRAAINRALSLRVLLEDESLRGIVGKIGSLPSLPASYHELCKTLSDPNCGMDEVASIVNGDPAMSVRVLQLVNSARFGARAPVTSIQQAVQKLGAELLKGLALIGNIMSAMDSNPAQKLKFEQLQLNWISSSRLAKQFVADESKAEAAFTATLIRDIGKVILASRLPGKYAEIEERMKATGQRDFVVEKELLGTTHAEIGAYLLDMWGLPVDIVDSVALHHLPRANVENSADILAAVYVAATVGDTWDMADRPLDPALFLDMEFLTAVGVADRVPGWLHLAQEQGRKVKKP